VLAVDAPALGRFLVLNLYSTGTRASWLSVASGATRQLAACNRGGCIAACNRGGCIAACNRGGCIAACNRGGCIAACNRGLSVDARRSGRRLPGFTFLRSSSTDRRIASSAARFSASTSYERTQRDAAPPERTCGAVRRGRHSEAALGTTPSVLHQ
jgi:hypothetical protein